jgi:hypothetical protein
LYLNYDVSKKNYTATSGGMITAWQFTNDFQGIRHGPISDSFLADVKREKQRKFCRCPEHKEKRYTHYAGFDLVTYLTISRKERASQPDTAPQNMRHLLSPCGSDVIRSTASSPAVKDRPMIDYVTKLLTDTSVDFTSSPPSRNCYHNG